MTLAERVKDLGTRAMAADDEGQLKTRSGEFTQIAKQINLATERMDSVAVARSELQSIGVEQEEYSQLQVDAFRTITELIETVNTLAVDQKLDAVKSQAKEIEQFFGHSEKWASDAWRAQFPEESPKVNDELLEALDRSGVDVEGIRAEIVRAETTMMMLHERSLPRVGDIEKLQNALEILSRSGERIGAVVDPVVADVLVRAQDEGAQFSDLTPQVVAELERLGILSRFRVILQ